MKDKSIAALATVILGLAALDDPTHFIESSGYAPKGSSRTPNYHQQRQKRNKLKSIAKASRKRNRKAA